MAITGGIVAGVGLAASLYMGNQQNQQAKAQMKQTNQQEQEEETQLQNEQLNEQAAQTSKAQRQKAMGGSTNYGAMGGTILTSPLGIPSQQGSGNKTLLGM